MAIAGIDYSLRGPCICIFNGHALDNWSINRCSFYFLTTIKKHACVYNQNIFGEMFDDWDHDCERYESIADWAVDKVIGCEQIALEGYAYSATGQAIFQIAENCGLLKYKLYQTGKPLEIITPSMVKKYATGKGNCNKDAMVKQFKLETGVDLQRLITPDRKELSSPVTDIADSYFICSKLHSIMNQRA